MAEPVCLYELYGETASAEWLTRRDAYEAAVALYESRQWSKACQALIPLLELAEPKDRFDPPTLKLMRRVGECLEAPPEPFDAVIPLEGN